MKILLFGKTGQLGADILRCNTTHEIIAPERAELDICSRNSVSAAIYAHQPDAVINTVDFRDVPSCEADPANAFALNCVAVRDLAIECGRVGAIFVTISTDYVFDGEKKASYLEDDKPAPLQIYGITRLAGEFAAMYAARGSTIIIRTCGLYGRAGQAASGKNFVDQRIEDAEAGLAFEMGGDQVVSPTYTLDLSKAILQLLDHPRRAAGIYHLVNEGKCSWFEFTKAIYDILGITVTVKPVDRTGKKGDIQRPLYSALANTKARSLGIVLPSWRNALERYLGEKYQTEK